MADASDVISDYIAKLLEGEEATKTSLEQRGQFVVTSVGAIVTVLFGLVAVITQLKTFTLPHAARDPIAVSIGLFALAILFGVLTALPIKYGQPNIEELMRLVNNWDDGTSAQGNRKISLTRLDEYSSSLKARQKKAWLLIAGIASELGGMISLVVATLEVVRAF